ncbi:cell division protein FtsA [Companilactobacillus sp.]|jgi:cell division protein FtsA|uniref:cell division protein FtsA n=1 Tax=Companilactobacillus sp. TaxID=2767905 RepID=UPI0025C27B03|nr:cell division protein FtsA [Companilactobacillus sp.]MCH4008444.1 cell division protein FtsA [Companilactobacillus sp.]MCH4051377.1 cell division protein FtsA [Companilactobacillus sp.]MCH4076387.1 cell division protein FtsA [Companilactobacillus sp.]MCH4124962.1 cell division protein FtsA [Companilactobacillus sp.]MCH4131504.1 cell division protein FtsA [Companilactobacillus sp.]
MDNSEFFVGLDIGTNSIKVVVAEASDDKLNVVGVGSERSEGVSRGVIVDIDKAAGAIKRAVKKAETQANITIKEVVVGISANMLQIEKCQGMIAVGTQSKEITENDVRQVMAAAMIQNLPSEREVVSLIPKQFSVDGFDNIRDPRGMIGVRLEMKGIIYTAPKTIVHNTKKAIQKAGLHIVHKVISPMALSQVALNEGEGDFGAIIMDLGAGQSTASVVHDYNLKLSTVDFEGGDFITHDISVVLNTTMENANQLKSYYGTANSENADTDDTISVDVVGQSEPETISEEYLSEIIEARIQQIFTRLKGPLQNAGALSLPGGIVLTGGVAATSGIEELAKQVFGVKVRSYVPEQMGMRHPSYALGLGLVTYASNLNDIGIIADNVVNGAAINQNDSATRPNVQPKSTSDESQKVSESKPVAKPKKKPVEKKQRPKGSRMEGLKNFWSKFFD